MNKGDDTDSGKENRCREHLRTWQRDQSVLLVPLEEWKWSREVSSTLGRIVLSSRRSNGDWTLREQNNFSTEGRVAKGKQSSCSL